MSAEKSNINFRDSASKRARSELIRYEREAANIAPAIAIAITADNATAIVTSARVKPRREPDLKLWCKYFMMAR